MSNQKPYNMGKSLHKKPDNLRTLIGVLIGFNAFLLLAVLGLMVVVIINKNGADNKETVSSVYEKSTAKTVSTSSLVPSAEEPAGGGHDLRACGGGARQRLSVRGGEVLPRVEERPV